MGVGGSAAAAADEDAAPDEDANWRCSIGPDFGCVSCSIDQPIPGGLVLASTSCCVGMYAWYCEEPDCKPGSFGFGGGGASGVPWIIGGMTGGCPLGTTFPVWSTGGGASRGICGPGIRGTLLASSVTS